ncbi:MAG TPA: hypothetical protein VLU25_06220 [Acidobacteriota bacterium]|nr:hypothetical protein [Acidobacteriota bacterium]
MSSPNAAIQPDSSGTALWRAQLMGLLRSEVRKGFVGGRALMLYLLAAMPVALALLVAIVLYLFPEEQEDLGSVSIAFAAAFQAFVIQVLVFVGCLLVFTSLFRGEMLQRSMHYYFLCPVRRELLVVGKYLAGQIAAFSIFGISVLLSYVLTFLPYGGRGIEYLTVSPGLGHVFAYLGVTALACLGYGAVFLLVGLIFRNPIIPGILIFFWESLNPFMPAVLQKISVIHYLISLCPVPAQSSSIRVIADPASGWFSVPGILLVTTALLYIVALRLRHTEISYGGD